MGQCRRILFFWALLFLVISKPVLGALGHSEKSVDEDRALLLAQDRSRAVHPHFVVREYGTQAVIVREYVSKHDGKVFGFVWRGRQSPSLEPLLGGYAEEYQSAFQKNQRNDGKRRIRSAKVRFQTKNLIIERGGHFGALYGRVLVTRLLPHEVTINDIQ
jgi:hypothetical protein